MKAGMKCPDLPVLIAHATLPYRTNAAKFSVATFL